MRRAQSSYGDDEDASDVDGEGVGYPQRDSNGNFIFGYGLNVSTANIGINILEVYLDGQQLPNSPFLIQVMMQREDVSPSVCCLSVDSRMDAWICSASPSLPLTHTLPLSV